MATADKLQKLLETKEAIRQAIVSKGVEISDDTVFADYAHKIDEIEAGSGGGESNYYWPEFFERRSRNANYLFANMNILDTETRYKELIENCDVSKNVTFMDTFSDFCTLDGCIKELDLTKWNVSNGASFLNMFDGCNLDYLDISGWNFTKVSSYIQLFFGTYIKEVNMTNCNISNITSHYRLCYQASNLVTINMTGCNTSKATNMNAMFGSCSKLITIIGEIDASNLTSGFYSSSSNNTFNGCTSLETVYLKNIYKDVTSMKNEAKWSINLGVTKVKDECLVYIINELPDLINDKGLTATDKIVFTLPPTNTLTAEQVQVAIDKGWQVANTTY